MRIAVASSGLGHVARGIEAWADDLATALAERTVDVRLCKGGGKADRPFERVISCLKRESAGSARVLRSVPSQVRWRIGLGNAYGVEQSTFSAGLIRLLRRERVDILHVQDPYVALLAQKARRMGFIRTRVILAHGTEEPLDFLGRIDNLQHLAPWHLEQAKLAGVWKPTWTAIPNFIDNDRFSPGRSGALRDELGIPRDGIVILTAAAIKRHHKRIDYLIEEFESVRARRPDLPVWFVLAGGWEPETDELVADGQKRLGERIRFLVRFPRLRMPDLYRVADVFVLASLEEMMPIALIEAASSGLPCVVNRHPILEWMTGPGGRAIAMSEPGALAATLIDLIEDATAREKLGGAAREHATASFSRDAIVDEILKYYGRILGEKSQPCG